MKTVKPFRFRVMLVLITGLAAFISCTTEPPGEQYMLTGSVTMATDNSDMAAFVMCFSESMMPVMDESATVTINGVDIPPTFMGYGKSDLIPVAVGGNVTFHFAYDGADFTSTRPMPAKPTITTADGSPYDPGTPITIDWNTVVPTPDSIEVMIMFNTVSGESYVEDLPGNATSHTIPAGTLTANNFVTVVVMAINSETNLGGRFSATSYIVCNQNEVTIDTIP